MISRLITLSGFFIIMTSLYLVPTTEAIPDPDTCAPCGAMVRRGMPWELAASESNAPDHTVRILQEDKASFTLTDKHTFYLQSSGGGACPVTSDYLMSTMHIRPFILADSFIVRIFAVKAAVADMVANPNDYDFKFDGVLNSNKGGTAEVFAWSSYPGNSDEDAEFFLNWSDEWGPDWYLDSYFYFNHASSLDTCVHTLEVLHNGQPDSSITLTATRDTPGDPNSIVHVVMSNITGNMFGAVTDDQDSLDTFTCE